jgi:hypothetical protein
MNNRIVEDCLILNLNCVVCHSIIDWRFSDSFLYLPIIGLFYNTLFNT